MFSIKIEASEFLQWLTTITASHSQSVSVMLLCVAVVILVWRGGRK